MTRAVPRRFAVYSALSILATSSLAVAQDQPRKCEKPNFMNPLFYNPYEQLPDSRIRFRLCAPDAIDPVITSVDIEAIRPAPDKPSSLKMERDELGYWVGTTPVPVPAGTYTYSYKIGGVSLPDPQGEHFSRNYRGTTSVLEVTGPAAAFQSYDPGIAHGAVATVEYRSASLGMMRRAHVYTPPGYEKGGAKRYPVLYLVHGAGDSDDSWTSHGRANTILDNLIAAGKATPMIVVMPAGHTVFRPGSDLFMNTDFRDDLVKDLIPLIDRSYRTQPDSAHRAMAGLSMGGAHTLAWGLTNSQLFGPIGIFSMGFFQPDQAPRYIAANDAGLKARAKSGEPVYFAMGKTDFLYESVAPTRAMMDSYGIKYRYIESEGGHTWPNWRDYLRDFYQIIFR